MKPYRALFIDAYCASHVGNDVLLESSVALLQRICPDVETTIHAKNRESFVESQGIESGQTLFYDIPVGLSLPAKLLWALNTITFIAIQVINVLTIRIPPHLLVFSRARCEALKDFEKADLVISIGGEMINDSFRKLLPMYLFMFWLAGRLGAKVVIFPQSIGPLRRRWTRWLTAKVLSTCTIVTARDQISLDELHSLGLSGNQALISPDVGVEQPVATQEAAKNYLADLGVVFEDTRIWIGITPSAWVEEGVANGNYLSTICGVVKQRAVENNIGILLMPANMPVHGNDSSDYDAAMMMYSQLNSVCPTYILNKEVVPARLFKAITKSMHIFISTRMHASILSTMAGTPTITINTQRKLYGYMKLIGQERFSLDIHDLSEHALITTVEEILANQENVHTELRESFCKVASELSDYADAARQILECEAV